MSDLTVDDLVTGRAAEELGQGVIPVAALLIVETMADDGGGLRFVLPDEVPVWKALGMLRSVQLHLESVDMDGWQGDDE